MSALDAAVLVVEDDDDIRSMLRTILSLEGYAVHCAADGAAALAFLRDGGRPRLILLDLMMPIVNGWEFREAQLRDPAIAGLPVVVLSGDTHTARKAAALDANGFLTKPVELEALLEVVRRYC